MRRLATYVLLSGLCCQMPATLAAPAASGDFVDIGAIPDIAFAVWAAGDGDQASAQLHCVASANTSKPNPTARDQASQQAYNFRISDLGTPAGYYLYLNGDDTATGNARIAVQFQHRDVKEGTGYQYLSDDVYDTHSHVGQYRTCGNGDNSEVSVTLSSTDLSMARGGTYTGSFRAGIRGGETGTATVSTDFQVSIDIASQVRISALDNVDLGNWMGVGGLTATETFCVYSNNATAAYSITISSPNQDAGGTFFMANVDASATIAVNLWFIDSTSGGMGTTVGNLAISGVGDNTSMDCGGIDNAKLTLTVDEADLSTAVPDAYGDTLTLLVAPE